jgi:hypothetical protein
MPKITLTKKIKMANARAQVTMAYDKANVDAFKAKKQRAAPSPRRPSPVIIDVDANRRRLFRRGPVSCVLCVVSNPPNQE